MAVLTLANFVRADQVGINPEKKAHTSCYSPFLFTTVPITKKIVSRRGCLKKNLPKEAFPLNNPVRMSPRRVPLSYKNMLTRLNIQEIRQPSSPVSSCSSWNAAGGERERDGGPNPGWARKTGFDRFPLGNFKHF